MDVTTTETIKIASDSLCQDSPSTKAGNVNCEVDILMKAPLESSEQYTEKLLEDPKIPSD